jgi:hypothetical protein
MFGSTLPPVVCRRAHVLFRMFGSTLPLVVCRRAHVLFRMFGSTLPPVVCRRAHVLFMLLVFAWLVFTSSCLREGECLIYVISVCLVCLYLQLFVEGRMSYLRY